MIHELKCEKCHFENIVKGVKPYEMRLDDRPFAVGDFLALNEVENTSSKQQEIMYTGRSAVVLVTHIMDDPTYCKKDYITMGILPCDIVINPPDCSIARKTLPAVPVQTAEDTLQTINS